MSIEFKLEVDIFKTQINELIHLMEHAIENVDTILIATSKLKLSRKVEGIWYRGFNMYIEEK